MRNSKFTTNVLFFSLFLFFFVSCTDRQDVYLLDPNLGYNSGIKENKYSIAIDDMSKDATDLFMLLSKNMDFNYTENLQTQAQTFSIPIEMNMNKKVCKEEIPIHIIDFKTEKGLPSGYIAMIADKRIEQKILAFYPEGKCEMFESEDADFWIDRISGYLYYILNGGVIEDNKKSNENETHSSQQMVTMNTKWHQVGSPYIDCTPFDGSERCVAGCTAVAMGEIIAYHKWPLRGAYKKEVSPGNFINMVTSYTSQSWNAIQVANPSSLNNAYKAHVSDLLAEAGYKLRTYYSKDLATAIPTKAKPVFENMGYKKNQIKIFSFQVDSVRSQIRSGLPVFMWGYAENGGGHAYVVDAFVITPPGLMIHIKNGNGGNGDNYFPTSLLTNLHDYKYRYDCSILYGVEPDFNNQGSTEIWQAP